MGSNGLFTVQGSELRLHPHWGQYQVLQSERRFILVLAGTQGGKTSIGPLWLWQEIQRRGPGDYMVVTPTYTLLELKALPEFLRLFEDLLKLGEYVSGPTRRFRFSKSGARRTHGSDERTQVFFGHAQDPDSLESATAKALWADEPGQKKFRLGSWEALLRRLALNQGRALLTTTPYDLGWVKQKLYDRWRAGDKSIDVINFSSTMNPAFPREEFERARADLPGWKFRMMYLGKFERPAGLIYDSFDETKHKVVRFAIPDTWKRYLGLDFGGVNTAGMFYAEEPETGRWFAYREYHAGGRSAKEHVDHLLEGEPMMPLAVGGSKSENQWRMEFRRAGLPVMGPTFADVEVGIQRVYGAHRRGEILVFDDLGEYLDQKVSYSRALDQNGEPTEEIEDKASFHLLDAERYVVGRYKPGEKAKGQEGDLSGWLS